MHHRHHETEHKAKQTKPASADAGACLVAAAPGERRSPLLDIAQDARCARFPSGVPELPFQQLITCHANLRVGSHSTARKGKEFERSRAVTVVSRPVDA